MQYCKHCIQPDTRPNTFFKDGICPACDYFSLLKEVDWDDRFEILQELIKEARKKQSCPHYDCIIGVSGGKDSLRQAFYLRDKLDVKPLLVCLSFPPEQLSERGAENLSNLIEHGFDVVVSAPSPQIWRNLKREGFKQFTNSFRSTEMALFSSVPQIAIKYGIKLIMWGENPGLQLGDMKSLGRNGYDGNQLRNMNTLSSGLSWMTDYGYKKNQLIPYIYPTLKEFNKHNLEIIYLGWFLGDWSLVNNASYSCLDGLNIREDGVEKTGDLFGVTALDEEFTPINQLIKYYKYGFGRVSDYVNEEIRLGRMSRDEGIKVATEYDDSHDENYIKNYCDYLEIEVNSFWKQVKKAVNRDLFEVNSKGKITPKFKVGIGIVD